MAGTRHVRERWIKTWARSNPWWVVGGCAVALGTSSTAVINLTFSLFMGPISSEFGWPRSFVSAGVSAYSLAMAACLPVVGRVVDRWGSLPALPVAVSLYAVSVGLIAVWPANPMVFIASFLLAGALGAAHSPVPYAIVISTWFDARRGTALGMAMAGGGLGTMVLPLIARWLIGHYGWRAAYGGLGGLVMVSAVPAVLLLVSDRRREEGTAVLAQTNLAQTNRATGPRGVEVRAATRHYAFWAIAISALLVALAANGTIAHLALVLAARGIASTNAASMLSIVGGAVFAGRLGAGYLLDRVFAPFVVAGTICIVLMGVGLLWSNLGEPAPMAAVACLGASLGAEFDIFGYLASRYFGLRRLGEISGYLSGIYSVAAALGPVAMGASYDLTHSYSAALLSFAAMLPVGIILLARLGPYPFPPDRRSEAPA